MIRRPIQEANDLLRAKAGDWVKVHYTGWVEGGEVFDSSEKREPVLFVLGEGALIPGFENAVLGMAAGERKTITVVPTEGFGAPREDLRIVRGRAQVRGAGNGPLHVGMVLGGSAAGTGRVQLKVVEESDSTVTLDGNHPLAGRRLVFEIELVGLNEVAWAAGT